VSDDWEIANSEPYDAPLGLKALFLSFTHVFRRGHKNSAPLALGFWFGSDIRVPPYFCLVLKRRTTTQNAPLA